MSMDISITLSDADLEHFVADFATAKKLTQKLDADAIIDGAREALTDKPLDKLPDFIRARLERIRSLIEMVEDAGFGLPDEERASALAVLAYFADPEDAIPDSLPVLGYLDDAIMIELCVREMRFEVEAYEDFADWRKGEAKRRGEDPAKHKRNRVEWAEARRVEAIRRMRRRRNKSYLSGDWTPVFELGRVSSSARSELDSPYS